ncbi:MAG: transcription termination/antitermination protein NusG [Planctomycetaceae bacterium]|jgi:transcriptional antiterminator NusG|nr:transcription termination/antitermination protein NusG [Planctomycetaceae bacterium]
MSEILTDNNTLTETPQSASQPVDRLMTEPAGSEQTEDDDFEVEELPPRPFVDESRDKIMGKKDWYILKVQVNREDAIKKGIEQRIAISGLQEYFGDILVPTEKIAEIRGDKKKIIKRKLYPGYLMIYMEINEDTWFLVRGIAGVGDFTGTQGKPTPMLPHEVQRILDLGREKESTGISITIPFKIGDNVKVKDNIGHSLGGFEGAVDKIDDKSGKVMVIINLFGRGTPVELEYWQIEKADL